MYNFFFFVGLGVFCVFIQSNLFFNSFVFPWKPDLSIPLTLYLGVSQRPVQGGVLALWIGFLLDIFSGGVVGIFMFIRVAMFLFVRIVIKKVFLENKIIFAAMVVVLFFFEAFLVFFIFKFMGNNFFGLKKLFQSSFLQAVFTFFVWCFAFPVFSKLENVVKNF